MTKKTRKSKKTTKLTTADGIFLGILFINFVGLYIHNLILPWLYLILVVVYLPIDPNIRRLPKIWHWLVIVYSPVLVSLYYLDFTLSYATLLVLGLAHYYVMKEGK
jgi:hypothetical protein